jgi:hypothetical protein
MTDGFPVEKLATLKEGRGRKAKIGILGSGLLKVIKGGIGD